MKSLKTSKGRLIPTSLVEGGKQLKLEIVEKKPTGDGPFPLVIFNHGSTGSGRNKKIYRRTMDSPPAMDYFTRRGWMVICPQRRGRGKSEGIYKEGFDKNRIAYSCIPQESLAGVNRAFEDLDAIMEYVATRDDVQQDRIIIAGVSRGGILAIAYAGFRPDRFIASINFSGGWLGKKCVRTYQAVNRRVFVDGAGFGKPTLWLHGRTDSYYGIKHCRENFDAYCEAGGKGKFHALPATHSLLFKPAVWHKQVDAFLRHLVSQVGVPSSDNSRGQMEMDV